ncbi:hypothetical protein FMUND_13615 [Fusarium mundagurra]|uniref:Uncharacterized protein n=1 Tax=Fusarium mundagurra TaxID=1567541 RepID=A0A8H6D3M1_9HYPO|nr:hypothetical protein FMUND_13615 [Fusarium mundagurra]
MITTIYDRLKVIQGMSFGTVWPLSSYHRVPLAAASRQMKLWKSCCKTIGRPRPRQSYQPPPCPRKQQVRERQRAPDGYRRRQERRQGAAVRESGGGHAEGANGVQVVEGHPSDAGTLVQQTAEAAVREASTSHPRLEATRLAQDISALAIANPAVQQRDAHIEQSNSGPQGQDQAVGDAASGEKIASDEDSMDIS